MTLKKDSKDEKSPATSKFLDPEFLIDSAGSWSYYQAFQTVVFVFVCIFFTYGHYLPVLYLYVPEEHHCFIQGGDELNMTQKELRLIFIPRVQNTSKFEKCFQYDVDVQNSLRDGIQSPHSEWPIVKCKNGWHYELEDYFKSVSVEFDFVCDNSWKGSLTDTVYFVGTAFGTLLNGWTSDHYGRYWSILSSNWCASLAGVLLGFSPNYVIYSLLRFIMGMFVCSSLTSTFVLSMEYVSRSKRTVIGNFSLGLGITLAGTAMPAFFYFFRDWRTVNHFMYAQASLCILLPFCVSESIRWLLERGDHSKAYNVLQKVANINGKTLDKNIYHYLTNYKTQHPNDKSQKAVVSIWRLFKTPRLRKHIFIMIILWSFVAILFETHLRNIQSLDVHIYISFAISSVMELPADIIIMIGMENLGRRWMILISLIFSGLPVLIAIPLQEAGSNALAPLVLTMFGRFCSSMSVNALLQFIFEICPTDLRARGSAMILFIGDLLTFFAPIVIYSARIYKYLPQLFIAFGGMTIGFIVLCLPETAGIELPANSEEGEDFGKNQHFFYIPCLVKSKDENKNFD